MAHHLFGENEPPFVFHNIKANLSKLNHEIASFGKDSSKSSSKKTPTKKSPTKAASKESKDDKPKYVRTSAVR